MEVIEREKTWHARKSDMAVDVEGNDVDGNGRLIRVRIHCPAGWYLMKPDGAQFWREAVRPDVFERRFMEPHQKMTAHCSECGSIYLTLCSDCDENTRRMEE